MTTPLLPEQFRTQMPAFRDSAAYPDEMINMWAGYAPMFVNAARWGDAYELGQRLWIAHQVTLDGIGNEEGARGGLVGFVRGPISSESGDKVSISYDTAAAMEEGAGHWNLTVYGLRFVQLARMFGSGALQVGPSEFGPTLGGYSRAWPGPISF